jgi:hypothetical protein
MGTHKPMQQQTQPELSDLQRVPQLRNRLRDQWLAIDPRGGHGIVALRSGAVVVDHDRELGQLCRRLAEAQKTSLTILYFGDRPGSHPYDRD